MGSEGSYSHQSRALVDLPLIRVELWVCARSLERVEQSTQMQFEEPKKQSTIKSEVRFELS